MRASHPFSNEGLVQADIGSVAEDPSIRASRVNSQSQELRGRSDGNIGCVPVSCTYVVYYFCETFGACVSASEYALERRRSAFNCEREDPCGFDKLGRPQAAKKDDLPSYSHKCDDLLITLWKRNFAEGIMASNIFPVIGSRF
jgi:hypothetical protein